MPRPPKSASSKADSTAYGGDFSINGQQIGTRRAVRYWSPTASPEGELSAFKAPLPDLQSQEETGKAI